MGDALTEQLTKWTEPKGADTRSEFCFVYDEQAMGIVGLTPSFGSDEFNDHHFHYGYFLYAAGRARPRTTRSWPRSSSR